MSKLPLLRSWLSQLCTRGSSRQAHKHYRPALEQLEQRQLLTGPRIFALPSLTRGPQLPPDLVPGQAVAHFDFGPADLPAVSGSIEVPPVAYARARGYGWTNPQGLSSLNRGGK